MSWIKIIIKEEVQKYLSEADDIFYDLWDYRDEIMRDTLDDLSQSEKGKKQKWGPLIPAAMFKKLMNDFVKANYQFVRNEKAIDWIEKSLTRNILQLDVNTELSGHKSSRPDDEELQVYGWETWDEFTEWMDERELYWTYFREITDYGLDGKGKLLDLLLQLKREDDYVKKLGLIYRLLEVTHWTSDLASNFIEGGSRTLGDISGFKRDAYAKEEDY